MDLTSEETSVKVAKKIPLTYLICAAVLEKHARCAKEGVRVTIN